MLGFNHAMRGLINAIKNERNLKIELVLFLIALTFGWFLNISSTDWVIILGISTLVLSLELINSAIERLCDLYSTTFNPQIKNIKDISAASVLIAAIFAIIMGVITFYPYIF